MDAVRDMTGHWPPASDPLRELRGRGAAARPEDNAFTVLLARSGERIVVPPGVSILEAMRARGHEAPSSCESGTCGTCRTRLVAGTADHRDLVLMDDESGRANHDLHIARLVGRDRDRPLMAAESDWASRVSAEPSR